MNKKKLIAMITCLVLIVAIAVGGSLAYFSDDDSKTNVFTIGNVDITLIDEFVQESQLMPATGSAQNGTLLNGIEKKVSVSVEEKSEPAWVRVHIAIPQVLDDGDPSFDASANVLHFNFEEESVATGEWDWSKEYNDGKTTGNWNFYTAQIEGIWYNVYVVTYTTIVQPGTETATKAMHQVYLDHWTTQEDVEKIMETLGKKWYMPVVAEGTQAVGFADPYTALNTAFGVPGEYSIEWPEATPIFGEE